MKALKIIALLPAAITADAAYFVGDTLTMVVRKGMRT